MSIKLKSSAGTREVPLMSDLWQLSTLKITDETDLDTLYTMGLYRMASDANVTNRPVEERGGLIVLRIADSTVTQIFISGENDIYIRSANSVINVWTAWKKITTEAM